jgi:hypothetical protein
VEAGHEQQRQPRRDLAKGDQQRFVTSAERQDDGAQREPHVPVPHQQWKQANPALAALRNWCASSSCGGRVHARPVPVLSSKPQVTDPHSRRYATNPVARLSRVRNDIGASGSDGYARRYSAQMTGSRQRPVWWWISRRVQADMHVQLMVLPDSAAIAPPRLRRAGDVLRAVRHHHVLSTPKRY